VAELTHCALAAPLAKQASNKKRWINVDVFTTVFREAQPAQLDSDHPAPVQSEERRCELLAILTYLLKDNISKIHICVFTTPSRPGPRSCAVGARRRSLV
jgi:hypothetical protein